MTEFPPEHFGSWQRITTDRYHRILQRPARFLPGLARLLRFKAYSRKELTMAMITKLTLGVDTTELDAAIAKAKELEKILDRLAVKRRSLMDEI